MRKLTELEQKCIDKTVELWNALAELEVLNDHDQTEMMSKIHDIQSRVMSRPYRDRTPAIENPLNKFRTPFMLVDGEFTWFEKWTTPDEIYHQLSKYDFLETDVIRNLNGPDEKESFFTIKVGWLDHDLLTLQPFELISSESIYNIKFKHEKI